MPQALHHRLLIIDDSPSIHEDFRKILCPPSQSTSSLDDLVQSVFGKTEPVAAAPEFSLDHALQGREGVALVSTALANNHRYSVAFVDMRMPPGWDGLETITQIWALDPDIQIVICTAHSDHSWAAITECLGFSDNLLILKKPFDQVEALQLAHALSTKWLVTQRDRERMAQMDRTIITRTKELQAAEERFAQAFNASPVAQSIQALDDGTILEVNAAHDKVFGLERAAVLGRTPEQLSTSLDSGQWRQQLAALTEGKTIEELPLTYATPAGELRHLRGSARPVSIANRGCAIWAFRDITTQTILEKQLIQAQKMDAFGQLAAGIAHDFNNMLTVIQGNASLLLVDNAGSPDLPMLESIVSSSQRAAKLVRQLLTFSHKQAMEITSTDMKVMLVTLSEMLPRVLGEQIKVTVNCSPQLPSLMLDSGMMEQLIMNLAVNARDAMPKGGQLVITAQLLEIKATEILSNSEAQPGLHLHLSVSDTGCGIPPEVLPRIFEPFFTTKPVGKGTGLGLATVYGIVKQHKGWIEVQSEIYKGTTFQIYIPFISVLPAARTVTPTKPVPDSGGSETIFVVEDEDTVRQCVVHILKSRGYKVITATNGVEAHKIWQDSHHHVDLLLTDMVMPGGLTGLDLSNLLLKDKPSLKIIFTSGYSSVMVGTIAPMLPPHRFLAKPYQYEILLQVIRDCLDQSAGSGR